MKAQDKHLSLTRLASRFWRDERGQTTTEYILILSVVVMIAMKFKGILQSRLLNAANNIGNQIDQTVSDTGQ